jgi:hypothetical protein
MGVTFKRPALRVRKKRTPMQWAVIGIEENAARKLIADKTRDAGARGFTCSVTGCGKTAIFGSVVVADEGKATVLFGCPGAHANTMKEIIRAETGTEIP